MAMTEVAIAIVKNMANQYLICLRPDTVHQGGKWEFPGGKIESRESAEQAMCRELKEEVGLEANCYELLKSFDFDYGDKQLKLNFYLITAFTGEAFGREGQVYKWVTKSQLAGYEFPQANKTVIALLS